ncbi:MAG: glycosyltransferase [Gemmatimonadota bacterium]
MEILTERLDLSSPPQRPSVAGKFLFANGQKLFVRGATYGTFRPDENGRDFPPLDVVERDFREMADNGFNSIRLYSIPPTWLLDQAARAGLWVLVGVPWEQHIVFLEDRQRVRAIEARVRAGVRACAGHPAVLGYTVGNEIPPSIVRWAGRRRVERHIRRLYDIARSEDPEALVTYGNFPSTEYLDLPFLDLVCFNVYLERPGQLEAYIARLQNLARGRPLILGELGLDSRRNGEHGQARSLHHQVRTAFASGCAGAFIFSWTDEWHRGGHDVLDWDFGLTDRERVPKPALGVVRRAFTEAPFPSETSWPSVSVVVCVHNGAATLRDCLKGLSRVEYPDHEIIVVDDGSTDDSAGIAADFRCRLIRTANRGLSSARNTGLEAATGEIVAYLDADARPDPHWLHYLAEAMRDGEYVGVGGPNLPCPEDGEIADCVANAPGSPTHILLSDREAEHIPGCNMAFRKWALEEIGGFDPGFRVAGDDVDVCWRLQDRGWKLGYSPAAVVWHHQRDSVGAYWRQQFGYGRAEALLEAKWPEKYNTAGHVTWGGRIYGHPLLAALTRPSRVYHGTWGTAPFQPRLYDNEPGLIESLAAAPEWYLVLVALGSLSLLGLVWSPLMLALPFFLLAAGASVWRAVHGAALARFGRPAANRWTLLRKRGLTALLFLLQPAARLAGRLSRGLTPWRFRGDSRFTPPWPRRVSLWSERWRGTAERLTGLERSLREARAVVLRGGPYDRWDLEVRGGTSGGVRLRMCVEEHGAGRQLVHFRLWPRTSQPGGPLAAVPILLALFAALDGAWIAAGVLSSIGGYFLFRVIRQCGTAMTEALVELERPDREELMLARNGGPARHEKERAGRAELPAHHEEPTTRAGQPARRLGGVG